jgi:hypothetical protein
MDVPTSRFPTPPPVQQMSWLRSLALVGVSFVLTTVVTVAGRFVPLDAPQVEIQLDIVKTGLAAGAGAGALVTLLYTAVDPMARHVLEDPTRCPGMDTRQDGPP